MSFTFKHAIEVQCYSNTGRGPWIFLCFHFSPEDVSVGKILATLTVEVMIMSISKFPLLLSVVDAGCIIFLCTLKSVHSLTVVNLIEKTSILFCVLIFWGDQNLLLVEFHLGPDLD